MKTILIFIGFKNPYTKKSAKKENSSLFMNSIFRFRIPIFQHFVNDIFFHAYSCFMFFDIILTKNSSLFLHAIHRVSQSLLLADFKENHTLHWFEQSLQKKSAKKENSSLFMNSIFRFRIPKCQHL
jgi:hypothetical protein